MPILGSGHLGILGSVRGEARSVAGSVDDELMSAVGEAVESGVGEDGIGKEADPLRDVAVGGDDERGAAVALDDERVEVLGLLLVEAVETEVIDYQEVQVQVTPEGGLEAVVGAGLAELAQEVVGPAEENTVVSTSGGSSECLGQEGLADTDGTNEEDMLLVLDERQREEFVEMATVHLDRRTPVEVVEADPLFEACLGETTFEGEMVSTLDLVGEDERKKAA